MSHSATKEQMRAWLSEQVRTHRPLPDQAELRRQLGMDLIESVRQRDILFPIRDAVI